MSASAGPELVRAIVEHRPPTGGLTFWWIGQHSAIVKLAGLTVYFDPYLSPDAARRTPALLSPEDVTNADLVVCSHDHADHIDPGAIPGIAEASPQALFISPHPARRRLEALGVPASRVVGLDDGQAFEHGQARITGVKAAHEFFDYIEGVGHPYMGYVLQADGCAVYHAGDTLCYEGLLTRLRQWALTVAFLPINGRDARRYRSGCIGNMTFQEAVDLAGRLEPVLAVPTHYDMFEGNTEDPALFSDYLDAKFPDVRCWIGAPGQAVDVAGATA